MVETKNSALCLFLCIGSIVIGGMNVLENESGVPWFVFAVVLLLAAWLFDISERAFRD